MVFSAKAEKTVNRNRAKADANGFRPYFLTKRRFGDNPYGGRTTIALSPTRRRLEESGPAAARWQ